MINVLKMEIFLKNMSRLPPASIRINDEGRDLDPVAQVSFELARSERSEGSNETF